jgi:hypothetical protein
MKWEVVEKRIQGERNRSASYVRIGVYIGVGEARCRFDPVFSEREDGKPGVSSWPGSGSVGNHAVGRCNGLIGGAGGEVPGPVRRGALGIFVAAALMEDLTRRGFTWGFATRRSCH